MSYFYEEASNNSEYDLWIHNSGDIVMEDEELSASSHEEASKLLDMWQTEDEEMRIMELDEQLGSSLLLDPIFDSSADYAAPSTGGSPIDELVFVGMDDTFDNEQLFIPTDDCHSLSGSASAVSLDLSEQYKESLRKLTESMKRSHETRKSLVMKTPKTDKYVRSTSVSGVISCTEKSSEQLQAYLQSVHYQTQ